MRKIRKTLQVTFSYYLHFFNIGSIKCLKNSRKVNERNEKEQKLL